MAKMPDVREEGEILTRHTGPFVEFSNGRFAKVKKNIGLRAKRQL